MNKVIIFLFTFAILLQGFFVSPTYAANTCGITTNSLLPSTSGNVQFQFTNTSGSAYNGSGGPELRIEYVDPSITTTSPTVTSTTNWTDLFHGLSAGAYVDEWLTNDNVPDGNITTYNATINNLSHLSSLNVVGGLYNGNSWCWVNFTLSASTPTPTPLPVSLFKQTDPSWTGNIYDGANLWATPISYNTIGDWGCAITSTAMVLKYNGINLLPDGTALNPGTLNTWLKNNNGYADGINNGYLVPGAITNLSKKAKSINNITAFDMLEASVIPNFNVNQLTTDLNNNQPDVLGVNNNSHFVAVTGINGNSFFLNDPYYNRTTLADYGNTFASITQYKPALSDGSYIMAIGTNNIFYTINNENGNPVGNGFVQNPIIDPITNNSSGNPSLNDFLPKPASGKYILKVLDTDKNPKFYKLSLYLYDKNANLVLEKIQGVISLGREDDIKILFDHDNANNTNAVRAVIFDSLLQDIKDAESLSMINHSAEISLYRYALKAKNDNLFGRKNFVKLDLDLFLLYLKIYKNHGVSDSGFNLLSSDANYLEANL